jgi:hypothetical protein
MLKLPAFHRVCFFSDAPRLAVRSYHQLFHCCLHLPFEIPLLISVPAAAAAAESVE